MSSNHDELSYQNCWLLCSYIDSLNCHLTNPHTQLDLSQFEHNRMAKASSIMPDKRQIYQAKDAFHKDLTLWTYVYFGILSLWNFIVHKPCIRTNTDCAFCLKYVYILIYVHHAVYYVYIYIHRCMHPGNMVSVIK